MQAFSAAVALSALLFGTMSGGALGIKVAPAMGNTQCKVTCHRFGMKSLGHAFQNITSPVECTQKCDEVYPAVGDGEPVSLLQIVASVGGEEMTTMDCMVTCHRFGMASLGPAFESISNPVECCTKCQEVYGPLPKDE